MAKILCRTKGNASPKGKPRVYFTCHPEDFEKYFDKIREDIFKTHDCAIFYTEDMTEAIAEEDKATDLESNNLFVVPVTFRLLSKPNRAMDEDIPFALDRHIPVLPFMMESGIDEFYSRPDKFGELQYLKPFSTDITEVSYEEKLKKYLEAVLISEEMANRVRAAFDAYIFLSYRKKDRRYANELMRLIHSHRECRDIAIWFDEFLTPGESFKINIEKALQNSKLFTLLVTPNLLEEPEGKPNFVMGVEYPEAKKSGIAILPAEMEATDPDALCKKYDGIPQCVDPHGEVFKTRLLETVAKIATSENDDDPAHNFLIGLAYLEGIDVEINRQRGLELITSAAEADLPEAMEKLYNMYSDGAYVRLDYRKAAQWAERLVEYYKKQHGEEHPEALLWLHNLAYAYGEMGDYQKAAELLEKVYALRCKVLGEEHPDTLTSLNNLAGYYSNLGDYQKAAELKEKVYALHCRVLGEEHPATLISLGNLASACFYLGEYQKAVELEEKVYTLFCGVLGEEHPDTLTSLNNLSSTYGALGNHHKALELKEKVYTLRYKILGEEYPATLNSLSNLASAYGKLGDYQKAVELNEKVYALRCRVLGEEHPDTLISLSNLAFTYGKLGDYQKEAELDEKVYALRCRVLGEEHPDTIGSLNNLAIIYYYLENWNYAVQLLRTVIVLRHRVLGKEHPDTHKAINDLVYICKTKGLCLYCGGTFEDTVPPKCSQCGRPKNY